MTPTLAITRFKSAYLLCHVNAINAHPMRIETGLQRASCERNLINLCFVDIEGCLLYVQSHRLLKKTPSRLMQTVIHYPFSIVMEYHVLQTKP